LNIQNTKYLRGYIFTYHTNALNSLFLTSIHRDVVCKYVYDSISRGCAPKQFYPNSINKQILDLTNIWTIHIEYKRELKYNVDKLPMKTTHETNVMLKATVMYAVHTV